MEIGSRKVLDRLLPELKEQSAWMEFFNVLFNDTTSYAYWDYVKTWEVDSNDPSKNIDYSDLTPDELEIPYGPGSLYNLLSACRLYSADPLSSSAEGVLAQVKIPILWVDDTFPEEMTRTAFIENWAGTGLLITGLHITVPMHLGTGVSPHKFVIKVGTTQPQQYDVISLVDGVIQTSTYPSAIVGTVEAYLLLRFPVSYLMWYLQLPSSNHANAWRLTKLAEDSVPCYNDCKVTIGGAPSSSICPVSYETPGYWELVGEPILPTVIYNNPTMVDVATFKYSVLVPGGPPAPVYKITMAGVDITDRHDIVNVVPGVGQHAEEKIVRFGAYTISGPIHIYIK